MGQQDHLTSSACLFERSSQRAAPSVRTGPGVLRNFWSAGIDAVRDRQGDFARFHLVTPHRRIVRRAFVSLQGQALCVASTDASFA